MATETHPPENEATTPNPVPQQHSPGAGTALVHLLERVTLALVATVTRPRVRTVLVGILLILLGALVINHSVWTFPVVIVGVVMVVVAWVGSRLEGRFGIEWSEAGAGFEMRARFKAAEPAPATLRPLPASAPAEPAASNSTPAPARTSATPVPARPRTDAVVEEEVVIEGEAHTIEIDVAELKALIEAAERAGSETTTANGTPVAWQETAIRVSRAAEG